MHIVFYIQIHEHLQEGGYLANTACQNLEVSHNIIQIIHGIDNNMIHKQQWA